MAGCSGAADVHPTASVSGGGIVGSGDASGGGGGSGATHPSRRSLLWRQRRPHSWHYSVEAEAAAAMVAAASCCNTRAMKPRMRHISTSATCSSSPYGNFVM